MKKTLLPVAALAFLALSLLTADSFLRIGSTETK
jgi:hypothetical protein